MRKILAGLMLCLISSVCFSADDFYFNEVKNSNCYDIAITSPALANATSCQFLINLASDTVTKSITGRFDISISSCAIISLYEDVVFFTTGTIKTIYNMNRTSSKTSQAGIMITGEPASIGSTGTTLLQLRVVNYSETTPLKIDSRIFAAGKKYILDINNNSGSATPVTVKFQFYEN